MNERDIAYRDLAEMYEAYDPMPAGLVEKVLVAIATDNLDTEYELLHLVERTQELAGARGSGEAWTLSFAGGPFSLLVRVSSLGKGQCRVDGWVTPPRPMDVTITQESRERRTRVNEHGRFEIAKLPSGLTRFWLLADEDGRSEEDRVFATPVVEL
jgi:hypothetical protein